MGVLTLLDLKWLKNLFYLQVHVGGPSYTHLRVFQSLLHAGSTVKLIAIKTGMPKDDPIEYFD